MIEVNVFTAASFEFVTPRLEFRGGGAVMYA